MDGRIGVITPADPRAAAAELVTSALAICEPAHLELAVILLRDALDVLTDDDLP